MDENHVVRENLIWLLRGGNAHVTIEKAVANFPAEYYNSVPRNVGYSAWQILEHMRRAQRDIRDFIINENYKPQKWPDEYWPKPDESADESRWQNTWQGFHSDLDSLIQMVEEGSTEFFSPLAHAPKYNIFREILLVADHNAYHLGQLVLLRKLLKIWP